MNGDIFRSIWVTIGPDSRIRMVNITIGSESKRDIVIVATILRFRYFAQLKLSHLFFSLSEKEKFFLFPLFLPANIITTIIFLFACYNLFFYWIDLIIRLTCIESLNQSPKFVCSERQDICSLAQLIGQLKLPDCFAISNWACLTTILFLDLLVILEGGLIALLSMDAGLHPRRSRQRKSFSLNESYEILSSGLLRTSWSRKWIPSICSLNARTRMRAVCLLISVGIAVEQFGEQIEVSAG